MDKLHREDMKQHAAILSDRVVEQIITIQKLCWGTVDEGGLQAESAMRGLCVSLRELYIDTIRTMWPDVTSEHDIHIRLSDASVPGKVSIHVHADIGLYCFKTDSGLSKTAEDDIIILRTSTEDVTKYPKK
jgi:hypothetical protein